MAVPGMVMFTLAGFMGQLVMNGVDYWRVKYILEHEESWRERQSGEKSKEDLVRDRAAQFERRFGFFEGIAKIRKPKTEERVKLLREEIEKLDVMLKKVDAEIAALEGSKNASKEI
jgi:hypothetical protein